MALILEAQRASLAVHGQYQSTRQRTNGFVRDMTCRACGSTQPCTKGAAILRRDGKRWIYWNIWRCDDCAAVD